MDCVEKNRGLCPSCLLSNGKKIEMREFTGGKSGLDLIEYFLKNGEVLETMKVISGKMTSQEKLKLCQKLLRFCSVPFSTEST
ncbi:F-box/FBD/LRR-repeat protein [Melia azedarach]|uniref:F-box/FBD/LRR-repeat protein n=1 Tax=Melia azedarach TaxID=155640 RepID=A0ACC1WV00_MELAZ|nr:F-box/FBD/LRR-repeat protein [Melia azedarach]